ncbi:hypothetical protein ACI2L4_19210 [Streptomyces sparsogenes]|uniref:hypothetical protein n=1 Tax=Streptomyces sparsogenes TaxID=67365 RepID=UPI0033CE4894
MGTAARRGGARGTALRAAGLVDDLSFRHPAARAKVLDAMSPAHRRGLHHRVVEQAPPFDLCVNIHSFTEMTPATVREYLDLIAEKCRAFYVKNPVGKFLDKALDGHFKGDEAVRMALRTGPLRKVIDVFDSESVAEVVPDYIAAYTPGEGWHCVAESRRGGPRGGDHGVGDVPHVDQVAVGEQRGEAECAAARARAGRSDDLARRTPPAHRGGAERPRDAFGRAVAAAGRLPRPPGAGLGAAPLPGGVAGRLPVRRRGVPGPVTPDRTAPAARPPGRGLTH